MSELTIFEAVEDLYRKARTESKPTSTKRLDVLARYCVQELAKRGLADAKIDPEIPGFARRKDWDVAWVHRGKVRLAISLKSLLENLGGTVPNRIDDLMGEVANLQLYSPEVVIGYLMIFNVEGDQHSPKHKSSWFELFSRRLKTLSGRKPPHWTVGTVEATALVSVDFKEGPRILAGQELVPLFFDTLTEQVLERNPDLRDRKGTPS